MWYWCGGLTGSLDPQSIYYDIYYLYGQEAIWDLKPSPLVSSGYTVIAKRNQLRDDIARLSGS